MNEENDDSDPTMQLRGTASRSNPFAGESAPDEPESDATITIHAPDGSLRKYELTDDVKNQYESMFKEKMESAKVNWYEMWWDRTSLIIQYEGCIRDKSLRPDTEGMSPQKLLQMAQRGQQPKMDGIPKRQNSNENSGISMRDLMQGGMPDPSVNMDISEYDDGNLEKLDEGIIPVTNRVEIDIQARAHENPLMVEDLFVKPWDSEAGAMPINTDHEGGEVDDEMFEVDFRDHTDDENTTVRSGARGDRWNI